MTGVDAGRELCRLLADPARPYRSVWEQRGVAYRGRALNQTAIAKVLAAYLVDRGLLADFEEGEWPRARRDWVRSRLSGSVLTHLELELFMDAFELTEQDRDALRHQLDADTGTGSTEIFTPGTVRLEGLPDRSRYAVVRVLDLHSVGASGLPTRHRTTQTIRARDDDVREYLYLFDSDTVSVEVVKGGSAGQTRRVAEGIWGVVISLEEPLALGETCELTYETTFAYAEAPPPRLRRAATADGTQIEMVVAFHPDRLPATVHQSTWAMLADSETLTSSTVALDDNHTVSSTWTVARAGLVGFSWTW
jgi:hypothetical protein